MLARRSAGVVAGTSRVGITYQIADAVLQPVRKPGGATEAYCRQCGKRQPVGRQRLHPAPTRWRASAANRVDPLLYPGIGWIASIIVLASEKFRRDRTVRFHAFQGLYLFVAWLMEDWVLRPMFRMAPELHIHGSSGVIAGHVDLHDGESRSRRAYPLPLFGELAQRSVAED